MPSSTHVFAQAEQEVYHACIEWPLWLALRRRQLEAALALATHPDADPTAPSLSKKEKDT